MDCKYCKKSFKNKTTLSNHQKTAKYCLKIQGKDLTGEFICENCGSNFTVKKVLNKHLEVCKVGKKYFQTLTNRLTEVENNARKDKESYENRLKISDIKLEEYKNRIKILEKDKTNLQKRYDKLAIKSTTTNNTKNIVNLSIFSKSNEDIDRVVDEKYTKDYLRDGQTGVAQFAKQHLINTDPTAPLEYVVTDRSRFHGKFVGENNESMPDTNMQGLTRKIHPSINKKACKIMRGENDVFSDEELIRGFTEVRKMIDDNSQFCKVFTKIHDVKNLPNGTKSHIIEFIIEDSDGE